MCEKDLEVYLQSLDNDFKLNECQWYKVCLSGQMCQGANDYNGAQVKRLTQGQGVLKNSSQIELDS